MKFKRHYEDIKENIGIEYILRACSKYQISELIQSKI